MLTGRTVILRLFTKDDLDEYHAAHGQIGNRGEFYPISLRSPAESRKQLDETGWWEEDRGRMLISLPNGKAVGDIGFFQAAPYQAGYELGYAVWRPEDRGHGIMTAAVRVFSAYLFELKAIPRLQVVTIAGNVASQRVAQKCGYRHEGTLRSYMYLRGKHHDCEMLALLRADCPSLAEALQS